MQLQITDLQLINTVMTNVTSRVVTDVTRKLVAVMFSNKCLSINKSFLYYMLYFSVVLHMLHITCVVWYITYVTYFNIYNILDI